MAKTINKSRKATLNDVAKEAKVDASTVSRILNREFETHKYSSKTVDKVHKAVEKLGYQPSLSARSLRTGKTMLIGVIVSDISNPFFSELVSHLDSFIGKHNYRLLISNTNEDPVRQEEHINGMLSHGVDGIIVSPSGKNGLEKAAQFGMPIITIDRPVDDNIFSFAGIDNIAAGHLLAKKLHDRGYKKIGVVLPDISTDLTFSKRLSGLKAYFEEYNIRIIWTVQTPAISTQQHEIQTAIKEKLQHNTDAPDAIVGLSNVCTIGIVEVLSDLGISWGELLGVAGIDDFSAANLVRPAITVVSQPIWQIAEVAANLLLKKMTISHNSEIENIMISPEWTERDSLPIRK